MGGQTPIMVLLPAGNFKMGSNGNDNGKPIHEVKINYEFAIGKYPVTFEEYDLYCDRTGQSKPSDSGWGRGKRPVINVSWHEAIKYCEWLSKETNKKYRLPSEAEWEYACRSNSQGKWCFGDNENELREYGWYASGFLEFVLGRKTRPVGEKKPNLFGLCDMYGNVWEWCEDVWHDNYSGAPINGNAWTQNGNQESRLLRGGSWTDPAVNCCSAIRCNNPPNNRSSNFGFRVVSAFPP